MRLSRTWLAEWVDITGLTTEAISEGLTCAGLEVETIDTVGPQFAQVVVAKISHIDPHPQADRLRLVTVQLSPQPTESTLHRVVCGAPNVAVGQLIAFAKEGATVYSTKQAEWFQLGQAVIRGVPSAGMICSLDELDLLAQYPKTEDGIWPLNTLLQDTHLGQPLEMALGLASDTIMHIVPTANRGDALSVWGIAKEVAAIFKRPLLKGLTQPATAMGSGPYALTLTDANCCTTYAGAWLKGIKVKPSPDWVAQRLAASGIRSINNVVDATNWVLLEMGQPMHAFDHAALCDLSAAPNDSLTIAVKPADPLTDWPSLDGVNRDLSEETPVVTCNQTPIAIAGIMGGQQSAVTDATTSIFLEAAHFGQVSTRKGAQALGLRTEASARFERGVDPTSPLRALNCAIDLLTQWATEGTTPVTVEQLVSQTLVPVESLELTLRFSRLNELVGVVLPTDQVINTLETLGFTPLSQGPDAVTVSVPPARLQDVNREIDLIEEVIRIAGMDTIPDLLPTPQLACVSASVAAPDKLAKTLGALKHHWVQAGFQEIMTPSLVSATAWPGIDREATSIVGVLNSHSPEHSELRQALWPSVWQVAINNLQKGQQVLRLFEVGRVYNRNAKAKINDRFTTVQESWQCVALLTGQEAHWAYPANLPNSAAFFHLKGALSTVLAGLGISQHIDMTPVDDAEHLPACWHPGRTLHLTTRLQGKPVSVGTIGEWHPTMTAPLKLQQRVVCAVLDIKPLVDAIANASNPVFTEWPYPPVTRDIAFKVPASISHQALIAAMQSNAPATDCLQHIQLFDVFRSEQFEPGERSMAYRLMFQSPEQTLTDDMVQTRLQQVLQQVSEQCGVKTR
jgi:phenylalanyl-tRNA synthetase beta chain